MTDINQGPMTTEILSRYREENQKLHEEIHKLHYVIEKYREDLLWLTKKLLD